MSSDAGDPVPLVPGRSCGECSLCCKLLRIEAFNKPVGTWCSHCAPGRGGCTIYETRPTECRDFYCAWLTTPALGHRRSNLPAGRQSRRPPRRCSASRPRIARAGKHARHPYNRTSRSGISRGGITTTTQATQAWSARTFGLPDPGTPPEHNFTVPFRTEPQFRLEAGASRIHRHELDPTVEELTPHFRRDHPRSLPRPPVPIAVTRPGQRASRCAAKPLSSALAAV